MSLYGYHGLALLVPQDAAAPQELQPGLVSTGNTFYAPTVGRGAVGLIAPLVSGEQSFYAATVAPGAVGLTAGLFSAEQQFYGPTVTSAYGLVAPLLSDGQTFHAPTVSAGAVGLVAPLLENEQQFYEATVGQPAPYDSSRLLPGGAVFQWPGDGKVYLLPGGQVVQPPAGELAAPLLDSGTAFYGPTVSVGAVGLLAGLLENAQTFYAPTVAFPEPYESSRLLPGGAVFQYGGEGQTYLLPGGQVLQPPTEEETPPTPAAAGGVPWRDRGALPIGQLDDRDLLEILPIVIGALNASRTH